MPRQRATFEWEDGIVCHRKAYSHVSPQACIELHVRNEDACNNCRQHIVATDRMSEGTDLDPGTLYQIAINGKIGTLSNPLIMESSKPDPDAVVLDDIDEREKGPKTVNVRILYINGRRMPQGIALAWRIANNMADRNLVLTLPAGVVEAGKPKNIQVDDIFNGRLQTCFEWRESDPEKYGPPVPTSFSKNGQKETQPAVVFRLFPANEDSYTR